MTEKEEIILKEIKKFYEEEKVMPTYRYLLKKMKYKSINSIAQYFKSLEKKNYLIRNKEEKLILNDIISSTSYKKIKIINKDKYTSLVLNENKEYLAFQIGNNYFRNIGIMKNDILIIEQKKKVKNGDLGLFIIDNKYHIMKYQYKDGFFILKDKEEIFLHKINLIGKVICIERKI